MNENTNNLFCYTAAIGFILDQADKMTNSKIYFHKVKLFGNKFLSEIAKHENTFADFVEADIMSESYTVFENIMSASLIKVDGRRKRAFNRKIKALINEYEKI